MNSTGKACFIAALFGLLSAGCYRGGARPVEMSSVIHDPNWIALSTVPTLIQDGEHDCGAAALAMVLDYWGQATSPDDVRTASAQSPEHGITAGFLRSYMRQRGMQAFLVQGTFADIERELSAGRPVLVGVEKKFSTGLYAHYQVVVGINPREQQLAVIDPAVGWREYSYESFSSEWALAKSLTLVVSPAAQVSQLGDLKGGGDVASAEAGQSFH